MKSFRRSNTSRTNGTHFHDPKPESGKRRSAFAQAVVLDTEDQENFSILRAQHIQKLKPADQTELDCIEEMTAAAWRLRRYLAIEKSLMNNSLGKRTEADQEINTAAAFSQLAAGPELYLLDRYERRLRRTYRSSLQNLLLLRHIGNLQQPNEPSDRELVIESYACADSDRTALTPVHRANPPTTKRT